MENILWYAYTTSWQKRKRNNMWDTQTVKLVSLYGKNIIVSLNVFVYCFLFSYFVIYGGIIPCFTSISYVISIVIIAISFRVKSKRGLVPPNDHSINLA